VVRSDAFDGSSALADEYALSMVSGVTAAPMGSMAAKGIVPEEPEFST
jgi:hypothetical protein